jgi:hypothetical protein
MERNRKGNRFDDTLDYGKPRKLVVKKTLVGFLYTYAKLLYVSQQF